MKILLEYFSVILLWLSYQFYSKIPAEIILLFNPYLPVGLEPANKSHAIYFALVIGIIAAGISTILSWMIDKKPPKSQIFIFLTFLIIGGLTLSYRNPSFLYWKPTIINVIFAMVFFASLYIGKASIAERIMGHAFRASKPVWSRLTIAWGAFFIFVAILNLLVAYSFSESTWVNFKLFGILGLTFIFILLQGFYLSKYIQD